MGYLRERKDIVSRILKGNDEKASFKWFNSVKCKATTKFGKDYEKKLTFLRETAPCEKKEAQCRAACRKRPFAVSRAQHCWKKDSRLCKKYTQLDGCSRHPQGCQTPGKGKRLTTSQANVQR